MKTRADLRKRRTQSDPYASTSLGVKLVSVALRAVQKVFTLRSYPQKPHESHDRALSNRYLSVPKPTPKTVEIRLGFEAKHDTTEQKDQGQQAPPNWSGPNRAEPLNTRLTFPV